MVSPIRPNPAFPSRKRSRETIFSRVQTFPREPLDLRSLLSDTNQLVKRRDQAIPRLSTIALPMGLPTNLNVCDSVVPPHLSPRMRNSLRFLMQPLRRCLAFDFHLVVRHPAPGLNICPDSASPRSSWILLIIQRRVRHQA